MLCDYILWICKNESGVFHIVLVLAFFDRYVLFTILSFEVLVGGLKRILSK